MKLKQKSSWITYKEMLNKVKSDSVKSWLTENGPITKRISANEAFELSLIRDEIDKVDEPPISEKTRSQSKKRDAEVFQDGGGEVARLLRH